jgi:REP element-mobilizing transposase RayT
MYHLVLPAKYRKSILTPEVDENIRDVCLDISKRYEIYFLEIGTDKNHVHFLIQSVPTYSPTKIATIIKSITAKQIFLSRPEIKKKLWGGEFWSDGYFVNTVSKHGGEKTISQYVKNQGIEKDYNKLYQENKQERLL